MPEKIRLDGKVALVTGAGSGIGRATAKIMARCGAKVGLLGHTMEDLVDTAKEIRGDGGEALELEADLREAEKMKEAVDRLAKAYGRLDIVFANAGVNGVWAPIEDLTTEEFEETIAINLTGTYNTIRPAVPHLKKQGGGSITITSSVNGTRIWTNTGATAYSCSKAAQVAMSNMLAVELGPSRIRVNVICPGAIETNIGENTEQRNLEQVKIPVEFPEGEIPLTGGEPGASEQVGELVLFLSSHLASHISGAVIHIDGAQSLLQG
jgi:NAD(P)-dependent dehydrogenase (short-subunit alcohol dehydrogenase family)